MSSGKVLVLCLISDAVLVGVSLTHHYHDTWLKASIVVMMFLSFGIFMSWIQRMSSLEALQDRVNEASRRELENEPEETDEPDEEEVRRLRRNARQRERRAEKRAQEMGASAIERRRTEQSAHERRKPQTTPAPASKQEPKSRWERLLADDDD